MCVVTSWMMVALAAADVVVLNNDGRVKGTLVNPHESPRKNYVIKTDAGEITIDKSQVKEVITQSPAEREYEKIRFTFPDAVEAQWKIAEWCREKGLSQQRTAHLERLIDLDPSHKQARAALGYGQFDGRWIRREDLMKERGYVWHNGRWMLPQDVEIQERKRQTELAQKEWNIKLRRFRAQLDDRGPRAQAALAEFKTLSDPAAVPAIADLFNDERSENMQMLLIDALGRIKSPDAVRMLADIAIEVANEDVRLAAVDYLKEIRDPAAAGYLVEALRSKENAKINRAGVALGELGDRSAIGPLIGALVSVHKEKVQQGGPNTYSPSFDSNGGVAFGAGTRTFIVRRNVQNRGVHEGLVKLAAGKDFGFDARAWGHWHAAQKKPVAAPGRRD
ncbi:MAG: HEAT repeat domain-containing protein [Pirellulales bacterium]